MKVSSERKDVVVIGGGFAGVCAAISAARKGVNVAILVPDSTLGNLLNQHSKFPAAIEAENCFPHPREGGIYEELYLRILRDNQEGTHLGQSRVLQEIVRNEKRVSLFLNCLPLKIELTPDESSIRSLLVFDPTCLHQRIFKSKFFIDCTANSQMACLTSAVIPVEYDQSQSIKKSVGLPQKLSSVISLRKGTKDMPFCVPKWIAWQWEENSLLAKVDLMESLEISLEGEHLIEWHGPSHSGLISSEALAWCAWDYLKNRSPISELLQPYYVESISYHAVLGKKYRGSSVFDLKTCNILAGKSYPDSVAVAYTPLPSAESLQFSTRNQVATAEPFEIPLRSLRAEKIRNLFWVGDNIFSPSEIHLSLVHTPTLSNLGSACGVATALLCNADRDFSDQSFFKDVQKNLNRNNQQTTIPNQADLENKALSSTVTASSTFLSSTKDFEANCSISFLDHCLLQIPILTPEIKLIEAFLEFQCETIVEIKLLEGSSQNSAFPGKCLISDRITFKPQKVGKQILPLESKIGKPGWHFLELQADEKFGIQLEGNTPYGIFLHSKNNLLKSKIKNPYSPFHPIKAGAPSLPQGPMVNFSPHQDLFTASNLINSDARPTHSPNLWISQKTNFKYPEFVELNWPSPIEINHLDITFDGAYNFHFPSFPQSYDKHLIHSIVKDYNIYLIDESNQSRKILEIRDNYQSFNHHQFENLCILGLEIEILSTHGLDRAQIYQIRVF